MQLSSHQKRSILGFGAAATVTPLAIYLTVSSAAFQSIPWTLSYLALALVAEIGGIWAALGSVLLSIVGVGYFVLTPIGNHPHSNAFLQVAGFVLTSAAIIHLLHQRTLAMSSLQVSEEHYRTVTQSALDVIVTIDEQSCILSINSAVKTVFGHDPEDLIGKSLVVLMPERLRSAHLHGMARHLSTNSRHIPWAGVQLPGLRVDGEEIPLEISFSSHTSNGRRRFTGFIRDISERQKAHTALMQSEKLAAVGRLSSSIAHEINNPLESVTNLLYLARQNNDVRQIQGYLQLADQELRRISVIANQTLQFHRQSMSASEVNCDDLFDGTLTLFQGKLANAKISLHRRQRSNRKALCIAGEIRQVLTNLIGNAIDATPTNGRILIRTRDATDWKSGRTGVFFTIADTGSGISPEVQERMFEPFFSTKESSGSGLGLWISLHLIAKNNGVLRVRSTQQPHQSGTVFTLFLPDASTVTSRQNHP